MPPEAAHNVSLGEYLDRAKQFLVPQGSVTERAVKSGVWVTLINVFDRILQLVKIVVLARILAPSDFGLMGIALLTLAGLKQFSKVGVDTALIQREEENVDRYLNTAWSMKALRGIAIVGVAYGLAPFAATFFNEPRAVDIIRVISLAPLIIGLQNPGVMYLRKNLEFHKQFVYTLTGTVVNVSVAIGAAVILQNVWALVFGSLAGSVATLIASYAIHKYRPWPELHYGMATELFDYGKWVLGSGILLFLINQGDDGFVGWFLGATALGFYQLAYRFSNAPATEVSHIISQVVFPTYSKIQDDLTELRDGYFMTLKMTSFVSMPFSVGIAVVAPTFVYVFLGEQWEPAILLMQIMVFHAAIRAFGATFGPLFSAIGRPDINTKLQVGNLLVLLAVIYPLTDRFGVMGAALAVLAMGSMAPIASYVVVRSLEASPKRFLANILYPAVGSAVMGVIVWNLRETVFGGRTILDFAALVVVGIVAYAVAMIVIESQTDYGVGSLFNTIKSSLT